ncbi:MAG: serine/threonine protein kinase [Chloroflexi bacterium]|nr:serine/threonine protein kinase [Chloroflexota bacterium]
MADSALGDVAEGPVEPVPGAQLGSYQLVERVGRGGMAEVWRAYQPSLSRYVALKLLPSFLASEPGYRERFRREALAVSQLRHPNILTVIDYGEQDGTAFIVSEFIAGGTLSEQLGRPLPVEYALGVLRPMGRALDYAHARGIVHRDVKPSNILLLPDGTPILADFGVAAMLAGGGDRLTGPGVAIGTPAYMSPEQVAGEPASPSADLYSLGVVLYEMLTGRPPYQAETPAAVALAHLHKPLPPPRSVHPPLPFAVEAVLLKALAKAPADRFASARAMIAALEAAEAPTVQSNQRPGGATTTVLESPRTATHEQGRAAGPAAVAGRPVPPARSVRRTGLLIGLLALATGLIVGGGLMFFRGPSSPLAGAPRLDVSKPPPETPLSPPRPTIQPTTVIAGPPVAASPAPPPVAEAQPTSMPTAAPRTLPAAPGPSPSFTYSISPLRELLGHTDAVWSLAFSPDGRRLASSSHQAPRVLVWDVTTGARAGRFDGHSWAVVSRDWDPRTWPDLVASGSHDSTVRLWDARTGQETSPPLTGHVGRVWAVSWARGGTYLASAADDGARLWAPGSGRPGVPLGAPETAAFALAWEPVSQGDGRLAVGYGSGKVILWDLATRQATSIVGLRAEVKALAWSPDGRWLAIGGADGEARLWSAATRQTSPLVVHRGTVWALAWSSDSRLLASGGEDGSVRLWQVQDGRLVQAAALDAARGPIFSLAWARSSLLAIGRQDRTVQLVTVR